MSFRCERLAAIIVDFLAFLNRILPMSLTVSNSNWYSSISSLINITSYNCYILGHIILINKIHIYIIYYYIYIIYTIKYILYIYNIYKIVLHEELHKLFLF
jgi:hypothetical protein